MSDEIVKKKIKLNQDDMTLGDLEEFEELVGKSFGDSLKQTVKLDPDTGMPVMGANGKPVFDTEMSSKGLTAIIYINLRKDDPDLTIEAVRSMKLSELDLSGDSKEVDDPKADASE